MERLEVLEKYPECQQRDERPEPAGRSHVGAAAELPRPSALVAGRAGVAAAAGPAGPAAGERTTTTTRRACRQSAMRIMQPRARCTAECRPAPRLAEERAALTRRQRAGRRAPLCPPT